MGSPAIKIRQRPEMRREQEEEEEKKKRNSTSTHTTYSQLASQRQLMAQLKTEAQEALLSRGWHNCVERIQVAYTHNECECEWGGNTCNCNCNEGMDGDRYCLG